MKAAAIVALSIVLCLLIWGAYGFFEKENQLSSAYQSVEFRLAQAKEDEANLQSDIQYLSNPLNLEKELRARFNYKKPGETMIVIVPPATSTATSSE